MTDFEKLDQKLELILKKVEENSKSIKEIGENSKRIKKIELTLENETNRNIQLIAEGHLNLDRKLDEALKTLQPNTMYHLKVNYLDGEIKKIKEAIGMV